MNVRRSAGGLPAAARMLAVAILAAAASAQTPQPQPAQKVRIAVLGDSISLQPGWPDRLNKLLGEGYEVRAFAANGTGVLRSNPRSVWRRYELAHSVEFQPNVMILMYDHSAGKKGAWNEAAFLADYKDLIARLKTKVASKPKLYICLPVPALDECYYGVVADLVNNTVVPAVRKVAEDTQVPLIDTHTPLKGKSDMIGEDGVFPTERGYAAVAATVYAALTGKAAPAQPELLKPLPVEKVTTPPEQSVPGWKDKPSRGVVGLRMEDITSPKGDGPDGKPNTDDDTWGFWFELAHARQKYLRLDLPTWALPEDQRKNGITDPNSPPGHQAKVAGPIASALPNANDTEGWIFSTDWDGRFEGVWADKKAGCIMAHPYVEKGAHRAVAITYAVPATGVYTISGKVADLQVSPTYFRNDGIIWKIEIAEGGEKGTLLKKGEVGDGHGRPDSQEFKIEKVKLGGGKLVRLVISPNQWWGTDLTRIDYFRIQKVE